MNSSLFAHIFNGFSNNRILEEARDTLAEMGHHVEWDDELVVDIPPDAPLLVVCRSLCQDRDIHLGGYFTFDVVVGPHHTDESVYSGVNDYGLLRLQFGWMGVTRMTISILRRCNGQTKCTNTNL
jgi:hypothetical protein